MKIVLKSNSCFSILLLFFFLIFAVVANCNSTSDDNFSSPAASLKFFADNTHPDNYKPEKAAAVFNCDETNSFKLKILAIKLRKILDAKSIIINPDKLPQDPDYIDSTSKKNIFFVNSKVPELYLEKVDDNWLISKETVHFIPILYSKLYPIETSRFIESLPEWTRDDFLGVEVWQYIGFGFSLILSFLFYKIFSWIFGHLIIKIISIFNYKHLAERYIKPVARPLSIIFIIIIFWTCLPMLQFSANIMLIFSYIYGALIPLLITIVGYRFVNLISDVMTFYASKENNSLDDNLFPLARKILKFVIIIFGLIYFLQNAGLNITPIIAGVSIGGLAFALAAQETIKNLFGSITLFTDKPFEVGDWIIFDKMEGTVEEIGIRSTRIRTFNKSLISIPNGKLSDMTIDNIGKRDLRRFKSKLAIPYSTHPDVINSFLIGIKDIVKSHPAVSQDFIEVRLNEMGENSLNILIYCFLKLNDWSAELAAREVIISEILKLAGTLEIKLPTPKEVLILGNSKTEF